MLPRIKTPDSNPKAGSGVAAVGSAVQSPAAGSLPAVAGQNPRQQNLTLLEIGTDSSGSIAGGSSSPGAWKDGGSRSSSGIFSPTASRVAFKEKPGPSTSSSLSGGRRLSKDITKGSSGAQQ